MPIFNLEFNRFGSIGDLFRDLLSCLPVEWALLIFGALALTIIICVVRLILGVL